MTFTEGARAWDKLPEETSKAFAAFQVYIGLSPFGTPRRTAASVREILNMKLGGSVERWMMKYAWVERAAAYDAWTASNTITLVQATKEVFAKQLVTNTSARLSFLGGIVEKMMKQIDDKLNKGEAVDVGDVKRVADMIKTIDDLSRRSAGLPTSYLQAPSEVESDDTQTYVLGGEIAP